MQVNNLKVGFKNAEILRKINFYLKSIAYCQ